MIFLQEENKLDFLLKHGLSLDDIERQLSDGMTMDELHQCVLDKLNGAGENISRYTVFPLLETVEKRVDGAWTRVACNTARNFLTIFRNDERFKDVRFNMLRGLPEKLAGGKAHQWTDADDAASRNYIESCYGIFNRQKYDDAFSEFQHEREYDPVTSLIDGVVWDGVARVETMLIRWLGAEDTPYNRECSRLLFAGGIHRAYRPGCKFDDVIVLVGKQGCGKSSFCQWLALAPELYSSIKSINGQKGLEAIQGKWIVEIEELLATLANDHNGTKNDEAAKAFLSTASDFYRKPYDRRPTDSPRHCIFIGTTNRGEFLTDPTGNRRWNPVRVDVSGRWLYQHEREIKADILQCWAEMKAAFDKGLPLARSVANSALLDTIRAEQEAAEQDDWRFGLVEKYLMDKDRTCLIQVWREALYADRRPYFPEMKRADANRLSAFICNKLGWVRGYAENFGVYGKQKSFHSKSPFEERERF